MAPIIGVTGYHVHGEEGWGGSVRGLPGQGFSMVGHDYIQAVEEAGGVAVGVPVGKREACRRIMERLDGLVLSGGEDIDPWWYCDRPSTTLGKLAPERDEFELGLIDKAIDLKKPILAICRGMQLINLFFGGTLYKDLSDQEKHTLNHHFSKAPRWYRAHRVEIKQPLLQELFGTNPLITNSHHHQAVDETGPGMHVGAVSEDGVIEAVYHPHHPQILAIQRHPEMMAVKYPTEGLLPFRWLMAEAAKHNPSASTSA